MSIKIISALSSNRVIGYDGKIPWFIKGELKRFKELTLNHNVLMGRKTFDSIGKILEQRNNIIISTNTSLTIKDAKVVSSFEAALAACDDSKDIFIIDTRLNVEVEVYDLQGRQIIKEKTKIINLAGYPSGVYNLTITYDLMRFNKRVIKQ